jgi:hypothetical protein
MLRNNPLYMPIGMIIPGPSKPARVDRLLVPLTDQLHDLYFNGVPVSQHPDIPLAGDAISRVLVLLVSGDLPGMLKNP